MTDEPTRPAAAEPAAERRDADPLSILALAGGIGALLLATFALVPGFGLCTLPLSVLSALTSLISGVASLVRTTFNPKLEGRMQAIAGLGFTLVWGLALGLLLLFAARPH